MTEYTTLSESILHYADTTPYKIAIVDQGGKRKTTYHELKTLSIQIATEAKRGGFSQIIPVLQGIIME